MNQILRPKEVSQMWGVKKTQFYEDIKKGILTKPVPLGPRARGFPADEIEALMNARIAGKSEAQLRELVNSLHEARKLRA